MSIQAFQFVFATHSNQPIPEIFREVSAFQPCATYLSKFGFIGKVGIALTTPIDLLAQIVAAPAWTALREIKSCHTFPDYLFAFIRVPFKVVDMLIGTIFFTLFSEVPTRLKNLYSMNAEDLHREYQKQSQGLKSDEQISGPIVHSQNKSLPLEVPPSNAQTKIVGLKPVEEGWRDCFADVNSSQLQNSRYRSREDFLADKDFVLPPLFLSKSEFVPDHLARHLMQNKKDSALGVKYAEGDGITPMEGAMHTFLTPITKIQMNGDYRYFQGHQVSLHEEQTRPVILSASIHPDFECSGKYQEVIMPLVALKQKAVVGQPLPNSYRPLAERTDPRGINFQRELPDYENALLAHMIYHLRRSHVQPSIEQVPGEVLDELTAKARLESLILMDEVVDTAALLEDLYVSVKGNTISLEVLFALYLNQIRNEFSVLEATLPQGYVYTIDPPAIFARNFGTVSILNRLQILAMKELYRKSPFTRLKMIGFNDFQDKGAIAFYQRTFPCVIVVRKDECFLGEEGKYSVEKEYALVEHNNSDAFGQNIETEGPTSKDGVIGSYSSAAAALSRRRSDFRMI